MNNGQMKPTNTDGTPTPSRAKRGRPGYDREEMLTVIIQVFTDHGYDASTLELIAKRLGLSKSAVYHHFSSKESMLEAALSRVLDQLDAVFEAPTANEGSAASRIRYVVLGAVRIACEQREALTLLLRLHGNSEVERQAMERRRGFDHRLRRLFELSLAEGTLRDDIDPGLASRLSFGLINSIVEWYRPGGQFTAEEIAASVVLFLRGGIRPEGMRVAAAS